MMEIRTLMAKSGPQLQFRYFVQSADASGALSAHGGGWSRWRDVPQVWPDSAEEKAAPHYIQADG